MRTVSLVLALMLCVSISGCASADAYRVQDEDLKVQWCPETGETTVHFDFGVASDDATELLLWRGGYHVSVTSGRAAIGHGVSHTALKSTPEATEEPFAPMTSGRAWRITVRGELLERPERATVSLRGGGAVGSREESQSLRAQFDLSAVRAPGASACQVLRSSAGGYDQP